jgi:hypothetical protein
MEQIEPILYQYVYQMMVVSGAAGKHCGRRLGHLILQRHACFLSFLRLYCSLVEVHAKMKSNLVLTQRIYEYISLVKTLDLPAGLRQ